MSLESSAATDPVSSEQSAMSLKMVIGVPSNPEGMLRPNCFRSPSLIPKLVSLLDLEHKRR